MRIDLEHPANRYRPIPFWSWNDRLDPEELRRQVREMHRAGLGGFFMHARGGLQTAYLSPEWMACVNACIDEAVRLGIEAWLYDENGWPSGFGNGAVNGLGVAYQQKYLRWEYSEAAECGRENTIAWYTPDGELLGRELPRDTVGKVLRCYYEINPYYVDNLDRKVVAEFLRVTHRFYADHIPPHLLKHLKGIFTDEPQLSRHGIVWSPVLEEEYRRAYRRELLEELPLLFLGSAASDAVRIRFWKLVARLFRDSFMKQVSAWCEEHGWLLTGHHLLEESCQSQLSANGSIMAQYPYYHIPGMDHLCRTAPGEVAMVQLVSAAMQAGRRQILTESFALTGWNFNFSGMCWMFQQQLACGINLLCQHLESYSLRGMRKRDYPGSSFIHQPWWEDYATVNDYFARAGMLLAEGDALTEVLVIHPQSTAWTLYTGDDREESIAFYSRKLEELTHALHALQISHHYADEIIAAETGALEGNRIRIGKCHYSLAIVPCLTNLSVEILTLLRGFTAAGGIVYAVDNTREPEKLTVEGVPATPEVRRWFQALPHFDAPRTAAEAAARRFPRRVRILEHGVPAERMRSAVRRMAALPDGRAGYFYFIANAQYRQPCHVRIELPRTGEAVELIARESGRLARLCGVRKNRWSTRRKNKLYLTLP